MDLNRLINALLTNDTLTARDWVHEAARAKVAWNQVPRPKNLDVTALAVAAGIVELLAERGGQQPPPWTHDVAAAPSPVYLVKAARDMPRLRRLCEEQGPTSLRRRRVLAPPDFLSFA